MARPGKFNGPGKPSGAIERPIGALPSVSAADLNFLIHHAAVRHPDRLSDEVTREGGSLGGVTPFCITGSRSEGRRSADYERGSRRSEKQIFHGIVLSFGPDAVLCLCATKSDNSFSGSEPSIFQLKKSSWRLNLGNKSITYSLLI
jgi:hypothetical protein